MSTHSSNSPRPKGLILTGGKSSRMGRDKAALTLHDDGLTQTERVSALLTPHCDEIFISSAYGSEKGDKTLTDLQANRGPLGGLEAAFAHDDTCEWFVVACDLPLLDSQTVSDLADSEGSTRAYKNRLDHRAEPLCAIYDAKKSKSLLQEWLAQDKRCARDFLESINPALYDLKNPYALDNANTPEDLIELKARLEGDVSEKTVSILLFAKLQDDFGAPQLTHTTTATTAAAVYEECRMSHNLSLKRQHLRVAINGDFAEWSTSVKHNDEIAFLPPVSGG